MTTAKVRVVSFATHPSTSAAKAVEGKKRLIAALKRCAAQNQEQRSVFSRPLTPWAFLLRRSAAVKCNSGPLVRAARRHDTASVGVTEIAAADLVPLYPVGESNARRPS